MRLRLRRPRYIRPVAQVAGSLLLLFSLCIWTRYNSGLDLLDFFDGRDRGVSVHLILASKVNQSYAWVANLTVPNLKIVPYMANDGKAVFHPHTNKGNEVMVYLTYLADFYEELPDIAIFTHGQDRAWHIDSILEESTAYALNHLDLNEVLRRQYVNLRVSWGNACPDWIHTDVDVVSEQYNVELKAEEPYMRTAFEQIFPNHSVPGILGQPCCSQFAVTKEAIRTLPREQYIASIAWLEASNLSDALSGRIWEHLWQYMFLNKPVDCLDERMALCLSYHICFQHDQGWEDWKGYERKRQMFDELKLNLLADGLDEGSGPIRDTDKNIEEMVTEMRQLKSGAIDLGMSEDFRIIMLSMQTT